MTAKEHFQTIYGNTYNTPFDSISMVKFAESYHLAKSKEEARERFEIARVYYNTEMGITGLFPGNEIVAESLKLAAFGKEG